MNKSLVKFLMRAYLKLRMLWDPIIEPTEIRESYDCSPYEFGKRINDMEYQPDPLQGLFDHTADPNTFYDDKSSCRDCDDFQRQWSWYGIYNGYEAYEHVVCDPTSLKTAFSTMHVIGTLEKNGRWYLTNYYYYGPFDTQEMALDYMRNFKSYSKDCVDVMYRQIKG